SATIYLNSRCVGDRNRAPQPTVYIVTTGQRAYVGRCCREGDAKREPRPCTRVLVLRGIRGGDDPAQAPRRIRAGAGLLRAVQSDGVSVRGGEQASVPAARGSLRRRDQGGGGSPRRSPRRARSVTPRGPAAPAAIVIAHLCVTP